MKKLFLAAIFSLVALALPAAAHGPLLPPDPWCITSNPPPSCDAPPDPPTCHPCADDEEARKSVKTRTTKPVTTTKPAPKIG